MQKSNIRRKASLAIEYYVLQAGATSRESPEANREFFPIRQRTQMLCNMRRGGCNTTRRSPSQAAPGISNKPRPIVEKAINGLN